MASHAICQFDQHGRIVFGTRNMTIQAPAHIHFLRRGNGHLADLSMAIFAIDTGCNMWTVAEVDKIRQDGHRHPYYGLGIINIISQLVRFGAGFQGLLVAGITHCHRGQACCISPQCSWMAVQTLNPQVDMLVVRELNWLERWDLGQMDLPCHPSDEKYYCQSQAYPDQRLFQELVDRFTHANSSYPRCSVSVQRSPDVDLARMKSTLRIVIRLLLEERLLSLKTINTEEKDPFQQTTRILKL
jgi:hypothetical protein